MSERNSVSKQSCATVDSYSSNRLQCKQCHFFFFQLAVIKHKQYAGDLFKELMLTKDKT